jgi:surface antigen
MQRPLSFATALGTIVLALGCDRAYAINELWAKDAPVSKMTAQDFQIAEPVITKALDTGKEGQVFDWKNPDTSASGSITPLAEFKKDGMRCRSADFTINAGGKAGHSKWDLCKTSGRWKFLQGR